MKQVDFYLLGNSVDKAKFKLACRLVKKLQDLKKSTLIVVDSSDEAEQMDQILWTFNDASFVAHDRLPATDQPQSSTHITTVETTTTEILARNHDVLLTLASDVPVFCHQFSRIAEIVEAEEAAKLSARQRFRQYKSEGFERKTHHIEL